MTEIKFFISTVDADGDLVTYTSDPYKLSELDMLNLIKICIVEGRSKAIGKKLLDAYEDCIERDHPHKEDAKQKLKAIGIEQNGSRKPQKSGNTKSR